jgi:hypothetical protein
MKDFCKLQINYMMKLIEKVACNSISRSGVPIYIPKPNVSMSQKELLLIEIFLVKSQWYMVFNKRVQ